MVGWGYSFANGFMYHACTLFPEPEWQLHILSRHKKNEAMIRDESQDKIKLHMIISASKLQVTS